MRGKRVKASRKSVSPQKASTLRLPLSRHDGVGKAVVMMSMLQKEMTPSGTWKEYWTKHLMALSRNNRLPRGFAPYKPFGGALDIL
jgi:hypothetical protein